MKKILLFVVACFTAVSVSASNVEKIQFANKGNFSLGLMVGIPPYSGNAVMPTVSIDGMWRQFPSAQSDGIKSGRD